MTEVFISGQSVYPEGGFVEIIKSINVLLEPDKRGSEYTRTVNIKGTKEADAVFMAQFDVNFNAGVVGFDPTKKADLVVYENTIEVMRGYCQLTDVVIVDEENHTYQCVFYGVVRDLFSVISNKKLNDIDFSDLDHAYNIASITASWSAPAGAGYVYPMVNYGWTSPTALTVQDFRPWIYCKEIFDRIMSEAGFEYTSNFINGSVFEKLIYNGDVNPELTQAAIAASNVQVNRVTNSQTITSVPALVQFNNTIDDPSTQWSGSPNFRVTADSSGIHNIDLFLAISIRNTGGNLTGTHLGLATFEVAIRDASNNVKKRWQFDITEQFGNINTNDSVTAQGVLSVEWDLLATEYIDVRLLFGNIFNLRSNGTTGNRVRNIANSDMEVLINTTSQLNFRRSGTLLAIGDTYDVGLFAAGTMLQREWLMGIIKMFNLYVEAQPNGTLLIEPREQFYTNQVIDLTPNLAVDREFTIKPLDMAKYKRYKYRYTEGKDLFGITYSQTYDGEPYGSTEIEIENDFAKDDKEVKLPFSLPCIAIDTVTAASNTPRVVPCILNEKDSANYKGSEIGKVLVWGGVRGTLSPWIFVGETTFRTGYPYAGQVDDLDSPTIELSFDIPQEIYWKREGRNDVALVTNGGLYAQYHEQEIEELTNRNSKIVECYLAINEAEYQALSFRKLIFIRNAYYRLHQVEYQGSEQLSKLTLLKLNAFAKKSGVQDDYFFDVINKDTPVSSVRSRGNFIDRAADGIAVLGVDHTVLGPIRGVLIAGGKDNIVSNDNVVVLNLSEQDNPLPNTINIGFNGDEYTGDAEYTGREGSPFYAIFTLSASANYDLAVGANQAGKVIKVKNTGANQVHVRENGSDVAIVTDSAEFYHTGNNWVKI